MEHKLISGGEQFLPFARSRIKALRATGLEYASQQFEIDGISIKVRISGVHEYITLTGGSGVASCPEVIQRELFATSFLNTPVSGVSIRGGTSDVAQSQVGLTWGKAKLLKGLLAASTLGIYRVLCVSPFGKATASYSTDSGGNVREIWVNGALIQTFSDFIHKAWHGVVTGFTAAFVLRTKTTTSTITDSGDSINFPGAGIHPSTVNSRLDFAGDISLISSSSAAFNPKLIASFARFEESTINRTVIPGGSTHIVSETTSTTFFGNREEAPNYLKFTTDGAKTWVAHLDVARTLSDDYTVGASVSGTKEVEASTRYVLSLLSGDESYPEIFKSPINFVSSVQNVATGVTTTTGVNTAYIMGVYASTKHVAVVYQVATSAGATTYAEWVDIFDITDDPIDPTRIAVVLRSTTNTGLPSAQAQSDTTSRLYSGGAIVGDYLWTLRYCLIISTGQLLEIPPPNTGLVERLPADYIRHSKDGSGATFYWLGFNATILNNLANGITNPTTATNGTIRGYKVQKHPTTGVLSVVAVALDPSLSAPGQIEPPDVIVGTSIGSTAHKFALQFPKQGH